MAAHRQKILDIHHNVDLLVNKFQKVENTKALENQIQKHFKEVRQYIADDVKEDLDQLTKLMLEKEEKTKYILQCKKGINTKELKQVHLKKVNDQIDKINKKINEFQKNVSNSNNQNNKKRKINYEKNIQFLRSHISKLEILKNNFEANKLYSVQNFEELFDQIDYIFKSIDDPIFQEECQKSYETLFILSRLKQSDILELTQKGSGTTPVASPPPQAVIAASLPKTQINDQPQRSKQQFLTLMNLSYENLPRWNDYIPSKQIKDTQKSKGIFPNYKMIDFSTISKMKDQTLFFIFYYMKGEMQQYFAAKELKNKHWRYNTKYLNWFRRHGEPILQMPQYEKATYIFFDYDKFQIRKRADFTMKFHQLEDKI